jgi:phage terminase large subunit-like protein
MTLTLSRPSAPSSKAGFRLPLYASPEPRLPSGRPYPSAGDIAGDWIEAQLVCGEGDYLGDPVRLAAFQRYILRRAYTYDPAGGDLLYDRILIGLPKADGKTQLFADVGLTELCGPLAPISPNIPVSAAGWDQANKLLFAARLAVEGDGQAKRGPLASYFIPGLHLLDDKILHPQRQGVLYRIAAVGGTNDGGLPTCFLGDEIHEWEGERRERVYVVQGKSLKKRRAYRPLSPEVQALLPIPVPALYGTLQIGISTAGPDLETLLGRLYLHGVKVATGEVSDPGFLFLWWEADERWDISDPAQLVQAILQANPAIGPDGFLSLESKLASFRDPTVDRHEFERYDLNRWRTAPDRWMSREAWERARHPEGLTLPPPGTSIAIGFDGSDVDDSTAWVGCTIPTDQRPIPHLFLIAAWERDLRDPHWSVPRDEVGDELEAAVSRWQVRRVVCDEARWQRDIEDWAKRYGADVVIKQPQSDERTAPAADRLRVALLWRDSESGDPSPRVTHDGSPLLRRHVTNAHTKPTKWGLSVRKEKRESPKKIDAAVAAIAAHDEAIRPPARQRRRSTFRSL